MPNTIFNTQMKLDPEQTADKNGNFMGKEVMAYMEKKTKKEITHSVFYEQFAVWQLPKQVP